MDALKDWMEKHYVTRPEYDARHAEITRRIEALETRRAARRVESLVTRRAV